ncbi:MAG: hypothetical protein MUO40_11575, partial [Anaerolineaceae bacterium]|nr:hypothetical protein [Anaerolineaceae bacterium]
MKKKLRWIIILIFCLASVSSNLPVSQGTAKSVTGSVSQTRAGTALTSLEGRELRQDMVYDPLIEQYLLVYEYVADAGEGFSYAIQAQLITSDGIPINSPIMISGPDGSVRQNPAVAYNSTAGEFLVIWDQEYAPTDHDIYVQRVDTAGELVGGVIMVDYTTQDDSLPDLVYNPVSGEYLAVWERYHTEQSEVYAQRLDGSGNPV